jgi:hypothetical protein
MGSGKRRFRFDGPVRVGHRPPKTEPRDARAASARDIRMVGGARAVPTLLGGAEIEREDEEIRGSGSLLAEDGDQLIAARVRETGCDGKVGL